MMCTYCKKYFIWCIMSNFRLRWWQKEGKTESADHGTLGLTLVDIGRMFWPWCPHNLYWNVLGQLDQVCLMFILLRKFILEWQVQAQMDAVKLQWCLMHRIGITDLLAFTSPLFLFICLSKPIVSPWWHVRMRLDLCHGFCHNISHLPWHLNLFVEVRYFDQLVPRQAKAEGLRGMVYTSKSWTCLQLYDQNTTWDGLLQRKGEDIPVLSSFDRDQWFGGAWTHSIPSRSSHLLRDTLHCSGWKQITTNRTFSTRLLTDLVEKVPLDFLHRVYLVG